MMDKFELNMWIICAVVIICVLLLLGGLFYALYKPIKDREKLCKTVGISKEECYTTMSVECHNDCRILNLEPFKWDKEGFGAWACYCLKSDGEVMKIW